jgi:hypothetical protein
MITGPLFESILEAFRNYTVSKDDNKRILDIMTEYSAYIFLAYKYIKTNEISKNELLYNLFFEFTCKYSYATCAWNDYLSDHRQCNFTIEEFINEIFLKNADDNKFHNYENIGQYYTGNDGYVVGSCSFIVLRMILLQLRTTESL